MAVFNQIYKSKSSIFLKLNVLNYKGEKTASHQERLYAYKKKKTVYYETGTERALLLSVLEAVGALGTSKANSKGSCELVLKFNFSSEKNTKEINKIVKRIQKLTVLC